MKRISISHDRTLSDPAYTKEGTLCQEAPTKAELPNDFCSPIPRPEDTEGRVRTEPWDAFITTLMADVSYAEINAAYLIVSDVDTEVRLKVRIRNAAGECVTDGEAALHMRAGEKTPLDMHFYIREPALWDDEHPSLYRIETEVYDGGKLTDTHEDTFGIRSHDINERNA